MLQLTGQICVVCSGLAIHQTRGGSGVSKYLPNVLSPLPLDVQTSKFLQRVNVYYIYIPTEFQGLTIQTHGEPLCQPRFK
jgi:hypothetical protein